MILLCGISSDPSLSLVVEAVKKLGAPYIVFDQRDSDQSELYLEVDNWKVDGTLTIQGQNIPINRFRGVFNRLIDVHQLPEIYADGCLGFYQDQLSHILQIHEALTDWMETAECRVMNRVSDISIGFSRVSLIQVAQKTGFLLPPTLITNNVDDLNAFLKKHHRVYCSPINSGIVFRNSIDELEAGDPSLSTYLPGQFQAMIPGTPVRVLVVGDKVFSASMTPTVETEAATKFSPKCVEYQKWTLPREIDIRCSKISHLLRLPLCGIDLINTDEGYYCTQVSSAPDLSEYQESTGQPVAEAVANYLIGTSNWVY